MSWPAAREVAATGTIRPDGTVGPIGGLEYKVDAVRQAGLRVFLVPASQTPGELAEARQRAGDDVEIVPVNTLTEALDALGRPGRPAGRRRRSRRLTGG